MKDNDNLKRFRSHSTTSFHNSSKELLPITRSNKYKKTLLKLLKDANALYTTELKTNSVLNSLGSINNIASTTSQIISDTNNSNKIWYVKLFQKSTNFISKTAKLASGNVSTMALAAASFGVSIATGGLAPIAFGATILGIKIAKTLIDAKKAMDIRKFNEENDALVDYATAVAVREQLMLFEPKLKAAQLNLYQIDKDNSKLSYESIHFDSKSRAIEKIVEITNRALDMTIGILHNPSSVASTAKHAVNFTKDTIISEITHTPEIKEQLRELINNERKLHPGYNDITEIRNQVREINIDNMVIKNVMKNMIYKRQDQKKYKSLNLQEIKTSFLKEKSSLKANLPQSMHATETLTNRILTGIKDALNPYSEYNINKQHSGIVKVTRKQINTNQQKPRKRSNSMPIGISKTTKQSFESQNAKDVARDIRTNLEKQNSIRKLDSHSIVSSRSVLSSKSRRTGR